VDRLSVLRFYRQVPPFLADALLAMMLGVLAVFEYTNPGDDGHQAGPLWLNAPLSVLLLLPLALRRRAPMATFVFGCVVVAVPSLFVDHTLFAFTGSFVTGIYLYTVARHLTIATARWAPVILIATIAIYAIRAPSTVSPGNLIFGILVYGLCWTTGRVLRRNAHTQQALAAALDQLAREQEQRERLAVLDERARLARDLHDVVAHAVALIIVQAGAARLALDDDLVAARASLLAIEQSGRVATGDLRRMLGLLRAFEEADAVAPAEQSPGSLAARRGAPEDLAPAPGLAQLGGLIEQMTQAGLEVDLAVTGTAPQLVPSLDVSVYRVVQEALTNVLKHAGPTSVRVHVDYTAGMLIDVVDDGPRGVRPHPPSGGHGLRGMQERVAMFGGQLRAGHQDRGFAVRVELPLPG
jgi:signal transduction histidine kinase